jgi:hypothetical protein
MGLATDHFIIYYNGHKVEVNCALVDLKAGNGRFRLLVDDEQTDQVECFMGTIMLHAKGTTDHPAIIVTVKQYIWATAYLLEGNRKIKMKRLS